MALIIEIKVAVQSGRQSIVLDKSGILKCFIVSAPQDGKANKEIVQLLSEKLGIKKSEIEIVAGLTSRKKKIAIAQPWTYQQFLAILGLHQQQSLLD
ncbi:DUF167 domain-containing protein [Candidatus Babeliales bacterium]|nr:DUF167 domain-containing protein [Candidatus Babeliales bacterium]